MQSRRWQWSIAIILLCTGPALADESFEELQEAYDKATAKWFQSIVGSTEPDFSKHPVHEFMPRIRKYAETHQGRPKAMPALAWLAENAEMAQPEGSEDSAELRKWVFERIKKDHAADADLAEHLPALQYQLYSVPLKELEDLYNTIIKKNKNDDARAAAMFNLAFAYSSMFAKREQDGEAARKADQKRAGELFRKIAKKYPDTDAAEATKPFIFELENLQIGMKAPEITGKDVNGKEIKLSQFHGQVVVLDFWGFW